MAMPTKIYAGVGRWRFSGRRAGVFRADADDGRWEQLTKGLPEETQVQAIAVHPQDPSIVFIGTQDGPYRSIDRGDHWERLGFPERGVAIWSVLVHPARPQTVFAGASPVAVYRSDDGGDNWRLASRPALPARCTMPFPPRAMRLAMDAARPSEIYAALEVNGVMRSRDGGESWEDCSADLVRLAELPHLKSRLQSEVESEGMLDCHALCVSPADPGAVFLALRMGLFRSGDRGESWQDLELRRFSPLTYARDIRVSPQDPRLLYAGLGVRSDGDAGVLSRSRDLGSSWERFDHGIVTHSTIMAVAPHPRDPDQIYGLSRHGQVLATQDGGRSWREWRLPEECRDCYALACG